jgi:hypothetical protein
MNLTLEDALRQVLRYPRAPQDLVEALRAQARGRDRHARIRVRWALAAALLLLLGAGWGWLGLRGQLEGPSLVQAVLEDFMSASPLSFQGSPPHSAGGDPSRCWSRRCAGFEATLPRSCPVGEVRGGRICRLRGMRVACYLLQGGRSLYVFPVPIRGAGGALERPLAVAAGFQASAWNEEGKGYVLVAPR